MRRSSGSAKPLNRLADCSYEGEMTALPSHEDLSSSAIPKEELERMTDDMIAALKTVYDPEIPVDIYELGLVYKIDRTGRMAAQYHTGLGATGASFGEGALWVRNEDVGTVSRIDAATDEQTVYRFGHPVSAEVAAKGVLLVALEPGRTTEDRS